MKPLTTFRTAAVLAKDFMCVSGAMDLLPEFAPYTRVITYDQQDEHLWSFHEEPDIVVSICVWKHPQEGYEVFTTLTQEGVVAFLDDESPTREKLTGAGLYNQAAQGWGYMSAVKQVGDHLYACGGAGQVYKRLGSDRWVHMDEGLLQPPDAADRLLPRAIDGPHESAIYLVGSLAAKGHPPRVHFWDGKAWREIALPKVAERITGLCVESDSRIWLCGANGTLLLGNAQQGFKSLSRVNDNQLFTSLCKFRERIYLASNQGLFVYDPADASAGIREVVTGLKPELQDANIVESIEDVLWSIGPKDIVRFDGSNWERIHHPDNPRIGS